MLTSYHVSRFIITILAVAVAWPNSVAHASATDASGDPVLLSSEIELAGDSSAVTPIRVPDGASINMAHSSLISGLPQALQTEGDGRLLGFRLVHKDAEQRTDILAVRLPEDLNGMRYLSFATAHGNSCWASQCSLPSGNYLLYLIADNSAANVTIRFDGVAGESLKPTLTPVPYDIQKPDPGPDLRGATMAAHRTAVTDEDPDLRR